MNVSPQTLVVAGTGSTANAPSQASTSVNSDDGNFAQILAAQNPASAVQNASGLVAGVQANPQGTTEAAAALTAPRPLGGLLQQGISAPHHDPITVSSFASETSSTDEEKIVMSHPSKNQLDPGVIDGHGAAYNFGNGMQTDKKEVDSTAEHTSMSDANTVDTNAAPGSSSKLLRFEGKRQSTPVTQSNGALNVLRNTDQQNTASVEEGTSEQAINTQEASSVTASSTEKQASGGEDTDVNVASPEVMKPQTPVTQPKPGNSDLPQARDTSLPNAATEGVRKHLSGPTSTSVDKDEDQDASASLDVKEGSKKDQPKKGISVADQPLSHFGLNIQTSVSANPDGRVVTNNVQPLANAVSTNPSLGKAGTKVPTASSSKTAPGLVAGKQAAVDVPTGEDAPRSLSVPDAGLDGKSGPIALSGSKPEKSTSSSSATTDAGAQPVTTSIAGQPQTVTQPLQSKDSANKLKTRSRDGASISKVSDDTEDAKSSTSAAEVNAATPQVASDAAALVPHTSIHSSAVHTSESKSTAAIVGEVKDNKLAIGMADATSFGVSQATKSETSFGSRNQQVEVGFHDGTLGWLSVRATAATEGGLHLSVGSRSNDAAGTVERMLPSLQHFLQDHDVRAHSVTYASQSNSALPASVVSVSTSSFSQDTTNSSAGDRRNGSFGQQQSRSGNEQREFSQRERNVAGRAFEASEGLRYESPVQEQGLLSIRI